MYNTQAMRLYFEVAKRSFQRQTAYRAANWAGFATNTFFGCLRAYVFVALFAVRPEVVGYRLEDALGYVWLTQALLMYTYIWGWWEVANSIRTGQIATDLAKPFDYYGFWLSQDAGRALYHLLFRGIPTYLAGVALFGVGIPTSAATWLWFLASLACAELVSFAFRFLVNLSTFWLLDYRGVGTVAGIFSTFFSGMLIPNAFFPDWLRAISDMLPFQGMLYLPSSVFLGKLAGPDLAWALGQQLLWFLGLMVLGRGLLGLATRRLVVQGG
jgi:ABC-2 type transport system permease protein